MVALIILSILSLWGLYLTGLAARNLELIVAVAEERRARKKLDE